MRLSIPALQWVRLYTRPNCGLCSHAHHAISEAAKKADFSLAEIDITLPENKKWHDLYAFDVPVVHVLRSETGEPHKIFMHRVTPDQVLESLKQSS